jgi:hypothetical protein
MGLFYRIYFKPKEKSLFLAFREDTRIRNSSELSRGVDVARICSLSYILAGLMEPINMPKDGVGGDWIIFTISLGM